MFVKIVMLGSGGSGKKELTLRYYSQEFAEEYDATSKFHLKYILVNT